MTSVPSLSLAAAGIFLLAAPAVAVTPVALDDSIRESGQLRRLAVRGGGAVVEARLVADCASGGARSARAAAPACGARRAGARAAAVPPPCRPVPAPGALPRLRVKTGDVLVVTTGQGASTVSAVRQS